MEQTGEKTERPTQRRLEEARRRGQFARSAEVQTVVVLLAGTLAFIFAGRESGRLLVQSVAGTLAHLHDLPVSADLMQGYGIRGTLLLIQCVWPLGVAALLGGLLAGGIQSHFQAAPDALTADWNRLNPVTGLGRLFSMRSAAPTAVALAKLAIILALTCGQVVSILNDPIFAATVSVDQIGRFLVQTSIDIILRVCLALIVIAGLDYAYQFWRTSQDLMMTKEEVKEEAKHTEGNPQVKARFRRLRVRLSLRRMYEEVPRADVVVTNPVHVAVALRYDRHTMRAPQIVAKGSRLHAQRIREIARQHQVPIIENKPLARLMFKHGKVGGEIPAQLYAAVAEILAWVYRMNRYRYYVEPPPLSP